MLDTIDAAVGSMAIMINFAVFSSALPLTARGRIALAAGAGLWIGLATIAGATGALAYSPDQSIPVVGLFFALPLSGVATLWLLSKSFRDALLAIPMSVLVGLNSMRVLGALFLALAAVGRLSGPFPYSAGVGDIITGVGAATLALALARGAAGLEASIRAWNIFGALDLFVAVGLGLTSSEGGPLHLLHVGVGSQAVQHLPFSLVPTVLVPFYLITHGIVAAQLAARRRSRREDSRTPTRSANAAAGA